VGASSLRYGYLKAGQLPNGTAVYATILTYPFTAKGEALPSASGPNILARASDFVNPISANASAITAAGASLTNATKTALITKFMAGLLEANAFLSQPQNKFCAVKAIGQQLDVSTAVATQEYAAATNPETGETATMQDGIFNVSRQGLLNVIDMRQLVGGFAGAGTEFDFVDAIVPGPGNFIDYTIRDAALTPAWRGKGRTRCW